MERLLYSPGKRADVAEHRYHFMRPSSPSALLTTGAGAKSTELLHRSNGALGLESGPGLISTRIFEEGTQFSGRSVVKMNEKEELRGLNERFSGFIDKVRYLESQNKELEREIKDIRQRTQNAESISKEYDPQLRELRKLINEISLQKRQVEIDYYNLEDEFHYIQLKYEQETRTRADTESQFKTLKKYICDAGDVKMGLDKKVQCLQDEIIFLKKNHEEEVAEMAAQIKEAQIRPETVAIGKGDITASLREIRIQLEGQTASSIHDAELGFRAEVAKLTKAAEVGRNALMTTKQEISDLRRKLQSKNIELESSKGMREALENQLQDLEAQHLAEIDHYQGTMRDLENELHHSQYDLAGHLQEYEDLLNVKMALDTEIFSYRKLLEGEECRYSIITDANASVPYIYRQSPVYTLPCASRLGGSGLRAEPQYKFVEEIITETTREDVEIDVTESEDEGDKVEKGSSEEEKESTSEEKAEEGEVEGETAEAEGEEEGQAGLQVPRQATADTEGDQEQLHATPKPGSPSEVNKASELDAQGEGKPAPKASDAELDHDKTDGNGKDTQKQGDLTENQRAASDSQEKETGLGKPIELKAEADVPEKIISEQKAEGSVAPKKAVDPTPPLDGAAEPKKQRDDKVMTSTSHRASSLSGNGPTEDIKGKEVGADVNAQEKKTPPQGETANNTTALKKESEEARETAQSTEKVTAKPNAETAKPVPSQVVDTGDKQPEQKSSEKTPPVKESSEKKTEPAKSSGKAKES